MNRLDQLLSSQQDKIEALLNEVGRLRVRARSSTGDGDRIPYQFVGSADFLEGDNSSQDIVFTVPEKTTNFIAERLSVYLESRLVTLDPQNDGPDEISLRPSMFTWEENSLVGPLAPARTEGRADFFISISETYYVNGSPINRQLQSAPIPSQLFFSGSINRKNSNPLLGPVQTVGISDSFSYPTGLVFPCPFELPGGSSFTLRVAPIFTLLREGNGGSLKNEYRLKAVLEGKKVVNDV